MFALDSVAIWPLLSRLDLAYGRIIIISLRKFNQSFECVFARARQFSFFFKDRKLPTRMREKNLSREAATHDSTTLAMRFNRSFVISNKKDRGYHSCRA